MRILSLLPAATEILHAIGLADQIVGISHECDYPPEARRAPTVSRSRIDVAATGGEIDLAVRELLGRGEALFELDERLIRELKPDVVVTQGLCPVCAIDPRQVDALCAKMPGSVRVIQLSPMTLEDILADILMLGRELGATDVAQKLAKRLEERKQRVVVRAASLARKPRLLVLEWLDPFFSAGHWNPQLVTLAGAEPLLCEPGQRSRQLEFSQVAAVDPDLIVIACCGFEIDRSLAEFERLSSVPWETLSAYRNNQIFFADGSQFFNRPGPRLFDTLEMLAGLIHGQLDEDDGRLSRAICRGSHSAGRNHLLPQFTASSI